VSNACRLRGAYISSQKLQDAENMPTKSMDSFSDLTIAMWLHSTCDGLSLVEGGGRPDSVIVVNVHSLLVYKGKRTRCMGAAVLRHKAYAAKVEATQDQTV
jgi:hypothetical protein